MQNAATKTVAEMTADELRHMIEDVVEDKLMDLVRDPDQGLELRPEFEAEILRRMERFEQDGESVDLETVARDLGVA